MFFLFSFVSPRLTAKSPLPCFSSSRTLLTFRMFHLSLPLLLYCLYPPPHSLLPPPFLPPLILPTLPPRPPPLLPPPSILITSQPNVPDDRPYSRCVHAPYAPTALVVLLVSQSPWFPPLLLLPPCLVSFLTFFSLSLVFSSTPVTSQAAT